MLARTGLEEELGAPATVTHRRRDEYGRNTWPGLTPPLGRRLLLVTEGHVHAVALPDIGQLLIGRDSGCAIHLDDPSVSRRHALLALGAEGATVIDQGSSNGTWVAGNRVVPGKPVTITDSTAIRVGPAILIPQGLGRASKLDVVGSTATEGTWGVEPRLIPLVHKVAPSHISVLIQGESGAGKDVLAHVIHQLSPRRDKKFLALNCAALTESLLESELFGHERGAFTGAVHPKPGLLELADGGTVFLDEIGDMPLGIQSKLLRIIETREVRRLGSVRARSIDVRFISATHRGLHALTSHGIFRHDLFFRLCGVTLSVLPLRERVSEIGRLARGFIERTCADLGRPPPRLGAEALALLEAHSWPGNVRELRNVIERGVLLVDGEDLLPSALGLSPPGSSGGGSASLAEGAVSTRGPVFVQPTLIPAPLEPAANEASLSKDELQERNRILRALANSAGNQSQAARELGVSRGTLIQRLVRYRIARPRKR